MKVKFLDRLLVVVCAVLLLFMGSALIVMVFAPVVAVLFANATANYSNNLIARITALIPAAIFLAVAIRLLAITLMREPKLKSVGVTVQSTSDGEIQISVTALDTLVKKCISSIMGIVEVNSKIIGHDDSITIDVKLSVYDGFNIPEITMKLQQKIKSTIQEESGIAVREVKILVDRVVTSNENATDLSPTVLPKRIASIVPHTKPEIKPEIIPEIEPYTIPEMEPELEPEIPIIPRDEDAEINVDTIDEFEQYELEEDSELQLDDDQKESQDKNQAL